MMVQSVKNRGELRAFIHLPAKLHRRHEKWVPPIYAQEWKYLSPEKNKAFPYCDVVLALAVRDGKPEGRIMGIINRRSNELRQEKTLHSLPFRRGA